MEKGTVNIIEEETTETSTACKLESYAARKKVKVSRRRKASRIARRIRKEQQQQELECTELQHEEEDDLVPNSDRAYLKYYPRQSNRYKPDDTYVPNEDLWGHMIDYIPHMWP